MKFNHQVYFPCIPFLGPPNLQKEQSMPGVRSSRPSSGCHPGLYPVGWTNGRCPGPGTTGSIRFHGGLPEKSLGGWENPPILEVENSWISSSIHVLMPKIDGFIYNGKTWSINGWELEVHWYTHDSGNLQMMNVGVCSRFFQAASGIFRVMFCSCTAKLVVEHLVEMLSSRRGLTRDVHISRLVVTKSWELLAVA